MEYNSTFNDYLLTIEDLIEAGIGSKTIEKAIERKQIARASRGKYLYKSLGNWQDQVKERFFESLEPLEWLKKNEEKAEKEAENELENNIRKAIDTGYMAYLNEYMNLGKDRAREYARAAAVLDSVYEYMKAYGIGVRRFSWFKDTLIPILKPFDLNLPSNALVLQRNYFQRMVNEGLQVTDVVKAPRVGNNNAAKNKTDEELMSWITYLRSLGANFSNAHIARIVKLNCELAGKTIPSDSWVVHELAKAEMKFITSVGRYNPQSRGSNPYSSSIPVANALFAGDCWQADGTRINMIPYRQDGKEQFLYIIAVRDVHSGDVLGMHFDVVENRWDWMFALADAVENTGYLPYQLVIDRFPGHNTEEFKTVLDKLARFGCKVTKSSSATGKAQTERWFGTLQSVFEQNSKYYYGEGVRSSRVFAHRTEEYLKAAKKEARESGFDMEKAITEAVQCVEMYRHTPLCKYSRKHAAIEASPAQLHLDSAKPNVLNLKAWQLADIFWPAKTLTLTRNQFTMVVNHEEAIYMLNDSHYGILKQYSGAKMVVRYNETNLDKIYVFDPETDLLVTELERTNRIQIYGPDAEFEKLGKLKAANRAIDRQRRAELTAAKEKAEKSLRAPIYMESQYDETAILMGRTMPKGIKEANESRMLTSGDDEELDIDVREMY